MALRIAYVMPNPRKKCRKKRLQTEYIARLVARRKSSLSDAQEQGVFWCTPKRRPLIRYPRIRGNFFHPPPGGFKKLRGNDYGEGE
jgi:hypothetical protein